MKRNKKHTGKQSPTRHLAASFACIIAVALALSPFMLASCRDSSNPKQQQLYMAELSYESFTFIALDGDWIYYEILDTQDLSRTLWRMKTDGTRMTRLASGIDMLFPDSFKVHEGRFYYITSTPSIYSSDIDFSNAVTLANEPDTFFYSGLEVMNGWIYFVRTYNDAGPGDEVHLTSSMFRMKLDGSSLTEIPETDTSYSSLAESDATLFYDRYVDGSGLAKEIAKRDIQTWEETAISKMSYGFFRSICISEATLFYACYIPNGLNELNGTYANTICSLGTQEPYYERILAIGRDRDDLDMAFVYKGWVYFTSREYDENHIQTRCELRRVSTDESKGGLVLGNSDFAYRYRAFDGRYIYFEMQNGGTIYFCRMKTP